MTVLTVDLLWSAVETPVKWQVAGQAQYIKAFKPLKGLMEKGKGILVETYYLCIEKYTESAAPLLCLVFVIISPYKGAINQRSGVAARGCLIQHRPNARYPHCSYTVQLSRDQGDLFASNYNFQPFV